MPSASAVIIHLDSRTHVERRVSVGNEARKNIETLRFRLRDKIDIGVDLQEVLRQMTDAERRNPLAVSLMARETLGDDRRSGRSCRVPIGRPHKNEDEMSKKNIPDALPHGPLEELFDDVWFVRGCVRMPGPVKVLFPRAMTVVRGNDGDWLSFRRCD